MSGDYERLPIASESGDGHARSPTASRRRLFLPLLLIVIGLISIAVVNSARSRNGVLSIASVVDSAGYRIRAGWQEEYLEEETWIPLVSSGPHRPRPTSNQILSASADIVVTPVGSQLYSYQCSEDWIVRGEVCEELNKKGSILGDFNVDIVWSYVGKSELLDKWRTASEVAVRVGNNTKLHGEALIKATKSVARHFRDHDELRYSMRSVQSAFAGSINPPRAFHLLVTDLPFILPPVASLAAHPFLDHNTSTPIAPGRIGQIPAWVNRTLLPSSSLHLHHHWDLFSSRENLPTFNSLAIESQLGNLNSTTEHVVYMNDDLLFASSVATTDFASPLSGPVFRLQQDLTVGSVSPVKSNKTKIDPEGEWKGMSATNWFLDQRFGKRDRLYIAHIAKAVSMPILVEVASVWREEIQETSATRFRGTGNEVTTMFLTLHYHLERHREALLWSYFIGRIDADHDGYLSLSERLQILRDLGVEPASIYFQSQLPLLSPVSPPPPDLPTARLQSSAFSSLDGCAVVKGVQRRWPTFNPSKLTQAQIDGREVFCRQSILDCFGEGFGTNASSIAFSTNDVFKRVAFGKTSCGDCLIVKIKSGTSKGLAGFLPLVSSMESEEELSRIASEKGVEAEYPRTWEVLSLEKEWKDIDFTASIGSLSPLQLRRQAISLLRRYSYTIAESPGYVIPMLSGEQTRQHLASIDPAYAKAVKKPNRTNVSIVVLNDLMATEQANKDVTTVLKHYFEFRWGKSPLSFENKTPTLNLSAKGVKPLSRVVG